MFRKAVIEVLTQALGADAEGIDIGALLTRPPKIEMGDLAFPCFPLAKTRRMAPPKIAAELAEEITPGGAIARVAAMGPYVNFFADPAAQLEALARALEDGSFFETLKTDEPTRVMIEFSQPNTHKLFHVGHLRNAFLGDALVRIFRARGHDVVAANYYGDFGIDVAKCLWWLRTHPHEDAPSEHRVAWLGMAYAAATDALKKAEAESPETHARLQAEVRDVLRGMEEGDPEITALFEETRRWCLEDFAHGYGLFRIHFDHDFFESQLEEAGRQVVDDYLEKGVFVESRGAVICDLEEEKLGAALVRKSDGASLYMTWDLALAKQKFEEFGIQRSIYVVGAEQDHHFRQLFATLERMGYKRAADCHHVSYELVMLPDGKMSSRSGTAIPMYVLIDRVKKSIEAKVAAAREKRGAGPLAPEVHEETVRRIVVACLRYGYLRMGGNRQVIFDVEEWTNPEGDTGAYLLYVLARVAGIHRKVEAETGSVEGGRLPADTGFGNEPERTLLNHLLGFPAAVARAEKTYDPSVLANWLFDMAKGFSRFYQECPVLKAESGLREARLMLVVCTEAVARRALDLLGIEPVEIM